jgi:TfoX/Sxy family transcriptional regulator of competence genes
MAYDEDIADGIRRVLKAERGITEKKMFGGLAFLHCGNMFVGVTNNDMMVRVGPEQYQKALAHPDAREMDFTGTALTGYVYVNLDGLENPYQYATWVDKAMGFIKTLPPK